MKHLLLSLLCFLTFTGYSQTLAEGQKYFNNQQYEEAQKVYAALLKRTPRNEHYNYLYARTCYELKQNEDAVKHFNLSVKSFPTSYFYIGNIYFDDYLFNEATLAYQNYINSQKNPNDATESVKKKIKQAKTAAELLSRVEDIAIIDSITVNKTDFLSYYKFTSEQGTIKQESLYSDSIYIADKITYTTQRANLQYFSDNINGQMDIYTRYKLLDTWSAPSLLPSAINTSSNENYPFLMLDGVTIYFASDNENSIGGYDIFVSRFNPAGNSYFTPENVGMPFNSPYNDYMMVIDEINKTGWFATDRYQPEDKVTIYTFAPNESKKIIQSEDEFYIRQRAQLAVFPKAEANKKPIQSIKNRRNNTEQENAFSFIINDTTVYTSPSDFKSELSLELLEEYLSLQEKLKGTEQVLSDLRTQYGNADDSQKQTLAPKIIENEKNISNLNKSVNQLKLAIIKEETNYQQQ